MAKTALVVEGGALRSVFSSGLLDGFMKHDFDPFDLYIGVSAGAANLLFYISRMPGAGYELYRQAVQSTRFISPVRFVKGGHLIDLDWLLDHLITGDLRDRLLNPSCWPAEKKEMYFCRLACTSSGWVILPQNSTPSFIKASWV